MVTEMTDLERIKELVSILNKAGKSYYSEGVEIMSNFEYDKLYDELVKLEEKTKIVLSDSPTVNVGYETLSELPKEISFCNSTHIPAFAVNYRDGSIAVVLHFFKALPNSIMIINIGYVCLWL